jgi:3-hydroxymyristoyl/3-hydroxydecanoyl-(acyl carrier protein) dehydratase
VIYERLVSVPLDHPCLPGHFPGRPIVPGVVLLEEVLLTLAQWQPERRLVGLDTVKFHGLVRPGEPITVRLRRAIDGRLRFECQSAAGVVVVSGVALDAPPADP